MEKIKSNPRLSQNLLVLNNNKKNNPRVYTTFNATSGVLALTSSCLCLYLYLYMYLICNSELLFCFYFPEGNRVVRPPLSAE